MARVIRPIQFDPPRKATRREKARLARRQRRDRLFEFGGKWFLRSFMMRMGHQPWDIQLKGDEDGNDNWEK
jgi:hypothetical protein